MSLNKSAGHFGRCISSTPQHSCAILQVARECMCFQPRIVLQQWGLLFIPDPP